MKYIYMHLCTCQTMEMLDQKAVLVIGDILLVIPVKFSEHYSS